MKTLAATAFTLVLILGFAPGAWADNFWHPGPGKGESFWHPAPSANDPFWHPAPNQAVPDRTHPIVHNPLWRRPVRTAHPHRFQYRGQVFVVIGAPLYASPWLYYPYALGSAWGPSYYVPGEPGYFLYYCADPPGYYPEVQGCPTGWLQTVPEDPQAPPGY